MNRRGILFGNPLRRTALPDHSVVARKLLEEVIGDRESGSGPRDDRGDKPCVLDRLSGRRSDSIRGNGSLSTVTSCASSICEGRPGPALPRTQSTKRIAKRGEVKDTKHRPTGRRFGLGSITTFDSKTFKPRKSLADQV